LNRSAAPGTLASSRGDGRRFVARRGWPNSGCGGMAADRLRVLNRSKRHAWNANRPEFQAWTVRPAKGWH